MKHILSALVVIAALISTPFAALAHEGEDHSHEQSKSVGEGAHSGKLSKAERKALREEKKQQRKEMKEESSELSQAEKKKMRAAKRAQKAEKVATPVKPKPIPTEEQIQKADAEDEDGGASESPE